MLQEGRGEVGHPAGVAVLEGGPGPGQVADGLDDVPRRFEGRGDGTARAAEDLELLLVGPDDGQVGRRLDQSGDLRVHGYDAMGYGEGEGETGALGPLGQ